MPEIPGLTSGLPRVMEGLCGGASVPRPCRIMSLESAPDRSYDVPPADERKGKTKAESDRHLGNPTVTHRSTMIRYPAGAMTPPGQKNVVGMKYWRRRNRQRIAAHARRLRR